MAQFTLNLHAVRDVFLKWLHFITLKGSMRRKSWNNAHFVSCSSSDVLGGMMLTTSF